MGIVKDNLYKFASKKWVDSVKQQSIYPYYHLISNNDLPHINHLYPYKGVSQFEKDLDFLLANYKPQDPANVLRGEEEKNAFLLTFDDGLSQIFKVVYPILKKKGVRAIFFVNPAYVDNHQLFYKHAISIILDFFSQNKVSDEQVSKIAALLNTENDKNVIKHRIATLDYVNRNNAHLILGDVLNFDIEAYLRKSPPYLTTEQIIEMHNNGFYFGGHTMTHPPLNQIAFEQQFQEIVASINWLHTNFNIDYATFAFPFSDKTASSKLINALFDYNPNMVLFGNSGLKKDIDPRIIQRFSIENPKKNIAKVIVTEHLYKHFNMVIGQYQIKRK